MTVDPEPSPTPWAVVHVAPYWAVQDREGQIVAYCGTGKRSEANARRIVEAGNRV